MQGCHGQGKSLILSKSGNSVFRFIVHKFSSRLWNAFSFGKDEKYAAKQAKRSIWHLPPFSLIRDFRKQNTCGNVSKISVNHACYRQIGSKSTNHSPLAWRKEGQKVTLVVVIGGFRSDLSITCMIDGNFGNVYTGVLFLKVAYQRKRW